MAIAAFGPWHEDHEVALATVSEDAVLATHSALETYSVLTRLPPPFRAPAEVALEYLSRSFPPNRRLVLDARRQRSAVNEIAAAGLTGGSVYDGLIALTAAAAGAELASLDARALTTYRRCGVEARLVG